MPTPTGLPKAGEIWKLAIHVPGQPIVPQFVVVIERGRGDYWSLRVGSRKGERSLWVDASYYLRQGWLTYVRDAGPQTRQRFGIGGAR